MSSPLLRQYHTLADKELEQVDGLTWERHQTTKACVLTIHYKGHTRKVFYPASPSDQYGPRKHMTDVRRTIQNLITLS